VNIFIVEPYTGNEGHFERWALRTCEALSRLRNDVTLVTYGGLSGGPPEGSRLFTVLKAAPDGEAPSDWRYHKGKIRMNSFRTFFRREMRELRTFWLAGSVARGQAQSILHFHDADPMLLTLVIRIMLGPKRARRPVIVAAVHEITRLSTAQGIKRRVYYWLYRRSLARLIRRDADGVLVFDPSLKQRLVSHFGLNAKIADRICVLPHGVGDPVEITSKEEARQRLELDPNETVFLVFGILRKDKRLDLAVEAVTGLLGCRLIIAGGAHDFTEATVKELIQRKGCEQWVSTDVAYLPEERMHDYFSACDAVIIPYDSSFRGQSGILTLACGHGKPVIASNVGSLGQAVSEHKLGFAVEPDSASALREGILRFLSLGPEERAHLEERVSSYASLMSWDNTCREWLDLYQTLLAARGPCSES